MTITLKSTSQVAIKGRMAKPANNEAFVQGAINGNNMTLVYRSVHRVQVSPRRWKREAITRFVFCERVYSPSHADFWWEPRSSNSLKTDWTVSNVSSR